jgi:predicted ArsR family transcriptional regulator
MSSPSDDEIRHAILELLLKAAKDNPRVVGMNKEQVYEKLQIPRERIEFNMDYLEQKGLVVRSGFMGPPYWFAQITAFGVDVAEHKERFAAEFPFIQVTIQHIGGNVYGPAVQAVNSQVTFNQQVVDAFKRAYDIVEHKTDATIDQKVEIKKNLKALEEELETKEADAGKIQKAWKWIQRNANWLVPTLSQVVIEGTKIALTGAP